MPMRTNTEEMISEFGRELAEAERRGGIPAQLYERARLLVTSVAEARSSDEQHVAAARGLQDRAMRLPRR